MEVYLEFLGTSDSILGSAAEVRQDLSGRLSSIHGDESASSALREPKS